MPSSFFPKLSLTLSTAAALTLSFACYNISAKGNLALALKLFMLATSLCSQAGTSYAFINPQYKQNFYLSSLLTVAQLALHTKTVHNSAIPITILASLYLDREKYFLVKQTLR